MYFPAYRIAPGRSPLPRLVLLMQPPQLQQAVLITPEAMGSSSQAVLAWPALLPHKQASDGCGLPQSKRKSK